MFYADPLPSLELEVKLPALKKGTPECQERIACRALREKKINRLTTEGMLPRRDKPLFLFLQKAQTHQMRWLTICHATRAMCLPALRE